MDPSQSPGRPVSLRAASIIPGICAAALLLSGSLFADVHAPLFWSFMGAGGLLLAWMAWLWRSVAESGRTLRLELYVKKQHWVQVIAQVIVYVWWGLYADLVFPFVPFIVAQVTFAYGVDALLSWSRRATYRFGFGPVPIILSINLFIWFRFEWFYLQFLLILVGFLGKELIRWQKDGRSAHIFNPSSLPLALASVVLIAFGATDLTFGEYIANSIFDPPYFYVVLVLAALPGQFLFGVSKVTLPAVLTMYLTSVAYFQATGTYLFFDAHIPVPVFLGMHLLITDPSTSPRTEFGRVAFGVIYALATTVFFVLLPLIDTPTFYDKLLPVPFMNLMVRWLDRMAVTKPWSALDPARIWSSLAPAKRSVAYASAWTLLFAVLGTTGQFDDRHPGQYLPFWQEACARGSERACQYRTYLTSVYCNNGSGWACNEWAVLEAQEGRVVTGAFERACQLGFTPGCENASTQAPRAVPGVAGPTLARGAPRLEDLPIVLRGTKPILTERRPDRLLELACEQGWTEVCTGAVGV